MERENAWGKYDDAQRQELEELCAGYRRFISEGKTERECVKLAREMAKKAGYMTLEEARTTRWQVRPGDRVMAECMGKSLVLFQMGKLPLEKGMNILGAHVDSPRIDLKQNPLYEDGGMALLDTHYYGGIKKYQWVAIPLALHGVVVLADGKTVEVTVGEDPEDPVLGISDLLIHLAADQLEKKAKVVIEGEDLDIIVGSRPASDEEIKALLAGPGRGKASAAEKKGGSSREDKDADTKEKVKAGILCLLKEKYGMEEEDFVSAELEAVPAGPARDFGLDRSMIMGYGQDDRICAYTSLIAQLEASSLQKTGVCLLVDKEEIGSVGATGMHSRFFENVLAELMELTGQYSELALRRALANSRMLSSDVSAAFDPSYASAFEKKNSAYLGRGIVFNKYTGSRGKSGSNDAGAEYVGRVRRIMNEAGVSWQTAELGRVDKGGGGTIAYIMANYGMEVIDSGICLLNMHAPWEVASKADIYEAKKGYQAFLKNA